ncbi:hypothetical protein A2870_02305 [Candidatus Curtissbacteria bacterium RIFCSPHIGHO2_01_FULL_41_11]|uniref:50S ribosomal protein L28 n=1 Tax=Candidatus Curtissbacteria bacterium RIFCSPHIGHO2_01_FULL_41_11 TaxID=1797711 RepID=A0A1F5G5J6_9BACT|nr:MAG: hypothetical protein A2870_02305 [Candidatus Curtissbacteria bacterium RIFCSPHIGHO2_01_FULL_41_11]
MRKCQVCGKGSMIQKSGAHQYGGGWAMRATKKRRVWMPNLHAVKVTYQGVRRTMRLCSKCLRRVKAQMKPYVSHQAEPVSESKLKKSTPIVAPKVKDEAPVAAA